MEIVALGEWAKRQLAEVTGLKPVAVTGIAKDNDAWHVRVDMLEMTRIPISTDVLGDYEVLLTEDGVMLKFERRRTRLRGEAVVEEGEA